MKGSWAGVMGKVSLCHQFFKLHMITIMMAGVIFGLHERMFLPRLRVFIISWMARWHHLGQGGQRAGDTECKEPF